MIDRILDVLVDPKAARLPTVHCRATTFRRLGRLKWLLLVGALGVLALLRFQQRPFEWLQLALLVPFAVLHFMPFVVKNAPPRGSDDDPLAVFTLVHGTFALDAPWTQSSSLLCEVLKKEFGGRVAFESFQWTGGNRIRDRTDAAVELRGFLEQVVAAYPRARPIIVAHSHGGNVSRTALAGLPLPERIGALVCLSTPFLNLHPRALGPYGMVCLKGIVSAPAIPFFAWIADQPFWESELIARSSASNVLQVLALLVVVVGFLLFFLVAPMVVAVISARAGRLLAAEPTDDPVPLLLIRSTSDEASMALLAMQFGGLLTQKAWQLVTICAAPFVRLARTTAPSGGTIRFGWLGFLFLAISFLAVTTIGLLAFVPMTATLLFMNLAGAGIGISGLLLEVSVEAAPVGNVHVVTLASTSGLATMEEVVDNARGADVQLAHSVHSRTGVGEIIAAWATPLIGSESDPLEELYTLARG